MERKMKDTGIEWIGKIPEEWDVKKVKYVANLEGRIGWEGLTSDEYRDEGPYLITGIDFVDGKIDWENCVHISEERWRIGKSVQIHEGDLLITKDGTVGKVAIADDLHEKASLNSGVLLITPFNGLLRRYFFWVLKSEVFWEWFSLDNAGNSTIIHLYQNAFDNFSFPLPSAEEQRKICEYLDSKCSKIDSMIQDAEAQIQILENYKKSLITEAVTHGLDKNVPLKDTGIEWIGKIPEDGLISKVKYFYEVTLGKMLQPEQIAPSDSYHYYLCAVNVGENCLRLNEIKQMWFCKNELQKYTLKRGDLLVVEGGDIGCSVILDKDLDDIGFQNSLHRVRSVVSSNSYLKYYLTFLKSAGYFDTTCNKATLAHFTKDKFLNSPFIYYPLPKQIKIAEYLDSKCSKIDSMILKQRQAVENLKKYKKSLIYEYVTGKKRVEE